MLIRIDTAKFEAFMGASGKRERRNLEKRGQNQPPHKAPATPQRQPGF